MLGAGAKGFSYKRAKEAAEAAAEKYFSENPGSSIKYVTIIEYSKEDEYQTLLECNECLKRLFYLLPKINGGEQLLEQTSELGIIKKAVFDKITEYTMKETQKFKGKYDAEKQEYIKTHSTDDLTFEENIYKELVNKPPKMTNAEFAELIYISHDADVSKLWHYLSNRSNQVRAFLSKKGNVLKLGLGLNLSYEKICRLMWSQGYDFPSNNIDYDIVNEYIIKGEYRSALEDYEEEFRSGKNPRETDISFEKEQIFSSRRDDNDSAAALVFYSNVWYKIPNIIFLCVLYYNHTINNSNNRKEAKKNDPITKDPQGGLGREPRS